MSNWLEKKKLEESLEKVQSERIRSLGQFCDTAVILHLYYPELWNEITVYLDNLGGNFDLFVSVCGKDSDLTKKIIVKKFPDAFVLKFENRGRDIGPFMEIYPVISKHYNYICKIHSKKSLHLDDGKVWRESLFKSLLGSAERVAEIKSFFNRFTKVGIIAPKEHLILFQSKLDLNTKNIVDISKKIGVIELDKVNFEFATGSMFWFRSSALLFLLDLNINQSNFDKEFGQVDGTLAHAIERVFGLTSIFAGYLNIDTQTIELYDEIFAEDFKKYSSDTKRDEAILSILKRIPKDEITIATLKQNIVEMECSYSWRITRPLRFVMRKFILKTWLKRYFKIKRSRTIF